MPRREADKTIPAERYVVSNQKNVPAIIFGTMTFGKQVDEKTADRMVALFLEKGHVQLDTAHTYADGLSEEILGRILTPSRRRKVYLATKVNPGKGGGLAPEQLTKQLELSLRRLNADSVDLLYLHAPDPRTPIEETLDCCDRLFRQSKFRELGLSNYASWQVIDIWRLCEQRGWMRPAVYQGMYNAITRDVERELFPALRRAGMRFCAYNPLAGGFLTGKYSLPETKPSAGRFVLLANYMDRYWRGSSFKALEIVRRACGEKGLTVTEGALRWLIVHSLLNGAGGDGIIIGASGLEQFEENLKSCGEKELPGDLIAAFDQAWEIVRPECPRYFRP